MPAKPQLRILTKYDMEKDTYWLTALYGAKSISQTFSEPPTALDRRMLRRRAKRDLVPSEGWRHNDQALREKEGRA